MANAIGAIAKDALVQAVQNAVKDAGSGGNEEPKSSGGGGSGAKKGLAAGAALAALAPVAIKNAGTLKKLAAGAGAGGGAKEALSDAGGKAGEGVGSKLKESVDKNVGQAGGIGGIAKDAVSEALPWGGGGGDSNGGGAEGVGEKRRMPVQQAVDVAVPLETAYNQWTQFEDWPNFMFRVNSVSQEDDNKLSVTVKQWNVTRQFTADIETQRPDERIKWKVSQGVTHTGVVTFHELAPSLTRIEVNIDIDPSGLIEKAGRGMRHTKRTVRSELHRFKAFIEMQETETGAWRGVIEEGEVVEEHPEDYDEDREYSEIEDAFEDGEAPTDEDEDSAEEEEDEPEEEEEQEEEEPEASEAEDEDEDEDDEEEERPKRSRPRKSSSRRTSSNGRSANGSSRSRSGKSSGKKAASRR